MSTQLAVIVSLEVNVIEMTKLVESLDYSVVQVFIQKRKIPDVNSYVGHGKLGEICAFLDEHEREISLVVVNGELKPSQWFNLEKRLKLDVYDRIRVILAIFEHRANNKEARLQVRLAQLQYERPFVRELIHRTRAGEHPGFMAGGEYQVDDYYEMIKKQMKKIRNNLEKIRKERALQRRHRRISGFYLLSLAGYTNAGKSSLLNLLVGEQVKVEGRLFSTLSTTTRKTTDHRFPILLTDTVGFIQDLPAWIIDAFHSTLEEIEVADVVLLLVDISEQKEVVTNKLQVSLNELAEIGAQSPTILVLNKTDLLSQEEVTARIQHLESSGLLENRKYVSLSVKNRENIDKLFNTIYGVLPDRDQIKICVPVNEKTQSFISWIYEKAYVSNVSYNRHVTLLVECTTQMKNKIVSKCMELGGYVL